MGLILRGDMLEEWLIFYKRAIFGKIDKIRGKKGTWWRDVRKRVFVKGIGIFVGNADFYYIMQTSEKMRFIDLF